MSRWKPRDPSIYPIQFFDIVEKAHSNLGQPTILEVCRDEEIARSFLDRFREWRFCLRHSKGHHRCSTIERDFRITTRTKPSVIGIQIFVTVKPRAESAILDLSLNPDLAGLSID